jgi:hypothetical protein
MVAIAAGLGVLNTVLMTSRDPVHDLGIFKAPASKRHPPRRPGAITWDP